MNYFDHAEMSCSVSWVLYVSLLNCSHLYNKYNRYHNSSILGSAIFVIDVSKLRIKFINSSLFSSVVNVATPLVQSCIFFFIYLSVAHWLFFNASLNLFNCPSFLLSWSISFYRFLIVWPFLSSAFSISDLKSLSFSYTFFLSSYKDL